MSDASYPRERDVHSRDDIDIVVGRNRRGEWIAVEAHGHCGGIFVTREDALRYAAAGSARPARDIRVVPGPIELRL